MTATLTATLLAAQLPRPVQLVLAGTTAGQRYVITGTTADGASWPVPGGVGVSAGTQIVVTDNRSALNLPIVYQALVDGVTSHAAPVTVAWDGVAVLQTLDGQTVVGVEVASVTEPRKHAVRGAVFEIAGRGDPAARLDVPGSPAYSWQLDTAGPDTDTMIALLQGGVPVVRRLTPGMRDLQPVVIGIVTDWSDVLISEGGDTWRRFTLTVRETADPHPSAVLTAYTWDDFDQAMTDRTWSDTGLTFDALFATWDEFDAADWSQYV